MFINRTQNLADMKTRIVSFIKIRGPSLPIHIFKETKTTLLLSSAFLSDLVSEKILKISDLKVGGSPLYFLPGQEKMLENFSHHLPGKEKEAFLLIKEKKVLKDSEQEPAIRVALRNIKDFAVPYSIKFQEASSLFWQYFSAGEEEVKERISKILDKDEKKAEETLKIEEKKPEVVEQKTEKITEETKIESPEIKIEEKIEETITEPEKKIAPIFTQETSSKAEKKHKPVFLEQVKSFLESKNAEILKIEKSSKKEIFIRIKRNEKEALLLALDKKKVNDSDIIKAYKKAQTMNLQYFVLAKGDASKKLKEALDAHKTLDRIEKLE